MKRVVVLGGCGAVGSVAAETLAKSAGVDEVVIADQNVDRARELAATFGPATVSARSLNAEDAESIRGAIEGATLVLNCVGPFYKTVKTILDVVIEAGIDYVDICDDVDVTTDLLEMNDRAERAGIIALIGMGASPGATNLVAKYLYDTELDETDSIDIFHCHGGEPFEGPGVVGHRFHCMSIDIPMFLDGELKYVKYFEDDGIALRQTFDFPILGDDVPLFPYPHPEQVTLPRYLDVRQVTNKGSVLPIEYYQLTGEICRLGLAGKEPLDVGGTPVVPYDFAVAYVIRERDRILAETEFGTQRGCMSIVLKGRKAGNARELRVHIASAESALGEGTGIPAALGALLVLGGRVEAKGVLPPEACVPAAEFLQLATEVFGGKSSGSGDDGGGGIMLEVIEADGTRTTSSL